MRPIDRWMRPLAIASASLLITSAATIGQVEHNIAKREQRTAALTTDAGDVTTTAADDPSTAAGAADAPTTVTTGLSKVGAAVKTPGATSPTYLPGATLPDFGLRTQGVTSKEVRVGYSYNVAACGDAGTLNAAFGSAVTGDPKNAIDAFTREVNRTGGISGRTLNVMIEDDGGGDCPEKSAASAVKMADEDKVFLAIPGLHIESDILIGKKVPVFGGRDDPTSLAKSGPNGLMLTEAIEPTLDKWSAFGKYYLNSGAHKPCMIHPESGVSGDWNAHEKLLVDKFKKYGMKFTDIIRYHDEVSTAQQESNTIAARAKENGCDQVFFMAVNPIALVFFTQAATQNLWFPTWTFTSYMVLSDTELAGRLMDQQQWDNAIGLSTRVPAGQHRKEGNCKAIYERYYPGDGQSESAATQIVCAQILTTAEMMRRAVARTGVLTASSWLIGADSIRNDFFYDAHVPVRWSIPGPSGPFRTKGFSHYTVVKWSSQQSKYLFPEYPNYWETMGPNKSGAQDLRPFFKQA